MLFFSRYISSQSTPEGTLKEDTDPDEPSQDRSLQDRSCRRCVPIESGIDTYIPFHHEDRRTGDAPPPDRPMRPRMQSQSRPDRKKTRNTARHRRTEVATPPMSAPEKRRKKIKERGLTPARHRPPQDHPHQRARARINPQRARAPHHQRGPPDRPCEEKSEMERRQERRDRKRDPRQGDGDARKKDPLSRTRGRRRDRPVP